MSRDTEACPLCMNLDPSHPDFDRGMCHEDCLATVDRWKRNEERETAVDWRYRAARSAVCLARVYAKERRWADVTAMFVEVLEHRAVIRALRNGHEGLPPVLAPELADTLRAPELKEVA